MTSKKYVETKTFKNIQENTDKLIGILNHNMTKMSIDISWLKKLQGWEVVILSAILAGIIAIAIAI